MEAKPFAQADLASPSSPVVFFLFPSWGVKEKQARDMINTLTPPSGWGEGGHWSHTVTSFEQKVYFPALLGNAFW